MQKQPTAITVCGVVSILIGAISLCGGGIRALHPENGVAPEIFSDAFESGSVRTIFYGSIISWLILFIVLIVAGSLMIAGKRAGRTIGLVWGYSTVAVAMAMMILFAIRLVPALSDELVTAADVMRLAISAPATGCCPTIWAVVLLGILTGVRDAPAELT